MTNGSLQNVLLFQYVTDILFTDLSLSNIILDDVLSKWPPTDIDYNCFFYIVFPTYQVSIILY